MPPKRMTANPVKPLRYRPGKPIAPEVSSDDDDVDEEDIEQRPSSPPPPPPPASSYLRDSSRITSNLNKVDLNERQRQAAADEAARAKVQKAKREIEEEEFETEVSEDGSDEDEESESEEEEDDSSEEEQPQRLLMRPTFIKKGMRQTTNLVPGADVDDRRAREDEERRKAADEIIQEQIRKDAEARAAGKKNWDDDEVAEVDMVDDTDGLDPEAELAAWKLRELKRVKRDRQAIEEAEKEREEIERRRNLTVEEREAEDREYIAQQQEDKEAKGKMTYMQKYFHKGAFFQDDAKDKGLDRRDIMGSRYQDDVTNRELLPQYMQIRDMTKLGKKGRTKYKDLKTEDTGRWGQYDDRRSKADDRDMAGSRDDRFKPDRMDRNGGATGANASEVGERRKKVVEGALDGPRAMRSAGTDQGAGNAGSSGDSYRPNAEQRSRRAGDEESRYRLQDRSKSPWGWPRSRPRPRSRSRSRSRSSSRSRSPRGHRDSHRGDRDGRKRSMSPYGHREESDKRRRVHAR